MGIIKQELRIRTGTVGGRPDYLPVGFITEENFGKGNIRKRPWIHISLLSPTLHAMARQFTNGESYVCLEPYDLPRGKPGPTFGPGDGGASEPPSTSPSPSPVEPVAKAPVYDHPIHGIRVPEYGRLVAHNVGGEWALSMIHKGSKEIIHEVIEWPESWPESVDVEFLHAEGFRVE